MMKVVFDCRLMIAYARTGIYYTCRNLLLEFLKREDLDVYIYFDEKPLKNKLDEIDKDLGIQLPKNKILTLLSDYSKMDVFFSPVFAMPDGLRKHNLVNFTLLHDTIPLIFPEYFISINIFEGWFGHFIKRISSKDFYFSNSEYTKKDFLEFFPQLKEHQITTTVLSTNYDYIPCKDKEKLKVVKEKYHIPQDKKYLFSLCSLEPRKNLVRAVKTFIDFINKNKLNDLVFVLGGGAWGGFIEKFEKEVPDYQKYKDQIIRAGYVADEDLEVLYSNAEWLVYTSQYEGFGMPPLEAMKCGCPVITSNNSSLPEVVGDAGIMIDWDSDEQHIEAYEKYYFDAEYRKKMAQKGLERTKDFSWEKTVDLMIKKMRIAVWTKPVSFNSNMKHNSIFSNYKKYVKLFGIIPLLKILKKGGTIKYLLFGGVPLFKLKQTLNKTIYYIFDIPILKIINKQK